MHTQQYKLHAGTQKRLRDDANKQYKMWVDAQHIQQVAGWCTNNDTHGVLVYNNNDNLRTDTRQQRYTVGWYTTEKRQTQGRCTNKTTSYGLVQKQKNKKTTGLCTRTTTSCVLMHNKKRTFSWRATKNARCGLIQQKKKKTQMDDVQKKNSCCLAHNNQTICWRIRKTQRICWWMHIRKDTLDDDAQNNIHSTDWCTQPSIYERMHTKRTSC